MRISTEQWMALGIILFYLYDCLRLIKPGRFYFLFNATNVSFWIPKRSLHLGSDALDLLNPLKPWQLPWSASMLPPVKTTNILMGNTFKNALSILRPWQIILTLIILIVTPTVILFFGLGWLFLLCFSTMYIVLIYCLFLINRHSKTLNLSRSKCISLTFECIFCPPFAVNVLRKIGGLQVEINDSVLFAERYLDKATFQRWRQQVLVYAEDQQRWYEPADKQYLQWQAFIKNVSGRKS